MTSASKRLVWIFNHYATTLDEGYGGRSYYQAKELANRGYEVVLIIAKNHHLKFRNKTTKSQKSENLAFKVVRLPTLPYQSGMQLFRVCNWFMYLVFALFFILGSGTKPNLVIVSIPTNVTGLLVKFFERFLKIRVILDVRDVWPMTLKNLNNKFHHRLIYWILSKFEKLSYAHASVIISPLPALQKRLIELKCNKKLYFLPTGIEITRSPCRSLSVKKNIEKHREINVCYMGTVGNTNALSCYFDLASSFQASHPNVKFYLIGEGHKKASYQFECKKRGLMNVIFKPAVPKQDVLERLSSFDVLFLSWHPHDTYQYGIGPNKLGEYLASGVPILHVYSGNKDPIEQYGCGITVPSGNTRILGEALLDIINADSQLRTRWSHNSKTAVSTIFDNRKVGEKLDHIINEIIK